MSHMRSTEIGVGDIGLIDPAGQKIRLAQLPPVQLLVLMRHRH